MCECCVIKAYLLTYLLTYLLNYFAARDEYLSSDWRWDYCARAAFCLSRTAVINEKLPQCHSVHRGKSVKPTIHCVRKKRPTFFL